MASRWHRVGVWVVACVLGSSLAMAPATAQDEDPRGAAAPQTYDPRDVPPKSVVLEDVAPGTVLWTRTYRDPAPAVARPEAYPLPRAPQPMAPAPFAPAPSPRIQVPAPAPPSLAAPVLTRQPAPAGNCASPCGQRRDADCYSLDWCGNRYGSVEITLEGTAGLMNDLQGPLGEPVFGPGAPSYDWDLLDHEVEFGGRGALRVRLAAQDWLEVRGAWYGQWKDTSNQPGRRFGFLPTAPFVSGVSSGVLQTEAEMMGIELNYVGELSCAGCFRVNLIAGARWLDFEEESRADFAPNAGVGLFGPGFVNSDVENRLIAGQLGANAIWDLSDRFEVGFTAKGILGNLTRKAAVTDANVFVGGTHASRSSQDEVVFGLEAELGFRVRLSSRIAFTAGYNLLFVDNVLRANGANDFTRSVSGAVQARQQVDQLIVHSVFAGFNFNF